MGRTNVWLQEELHRSELLARGYCVSSVELDDETVREYVKRQEEEDKKLDQLKMFEVDDPLSSGS